jgi:hypothetical protein
VRPLTLADREIIRAVAGWRARHLGFEMTWPDVVDLFHALGYRRVAWEHPTDG